MAVKFFMEHHLSNKPTAFPLLQPKCLMWDIGIKSRYRNGFEMLTQTQKILDQLYSAPGLQDTMLDLYRPIEIPCLNPATANLVDQQ